MRRAKGTIDVFTFKEGILARAAHDLQIRLGQFDITLDGDAVRGSFPLKSLTLVGPVEDGVVQPDQYDAGKRADVEKAMNTEVLNTEAHPTAAFNGKATPKGDGYTVNGTLDLAGGTAPVTFDVRKEGSEYKGAFDIQPSQWGIAQYKAMLGAIRLKDTVRITFALSDT
jgi:hypothetical protein